MKKLVLKIRGLDCMEEVLVLRKEVGPLVGGEDRLSFDILSGKMAVVDLPRDITLDAHQLPLNPGLAHGLHRSPLRPDRRHPRTLDTMDAVLDLGWSFVALAGAAMLQGLILVSFIRLLIAKGLSKREAIEEAWLVRLRPVLMTGLVAALGFVPMAFSTGVGAEVQRPLATVVVFGIATDTVLTMLVLPAMYLLFGKGPQGDSADRDQSDTREIEGE